ncbi:MAG: ABC transporter ATP-binding protein [Desulfurococcaceae archaeon]
MILVIRNLVKYFDSRKVLDDVSWTVETPGVYSLLGPNGAGKTTLLGIVSGVVNFDKGEVRVKGLPPGDPVARRAIGYCPQEPGLIDSISGYDNALFYGRLYGLTTNEIISRTRNMAELLGLRDADLRMKAGKYSGGMKKKLALVVSLLHDPEVLILDEPTTGLDPGVRRNVWDLVLKLREEGRTVILATHYMDEADRLSDRVAIIDRGKILAEGKPEELKEKYGPPSVVELVFDSEVHSAATRIIEKYTVKHYIEGKTARLHLDEPDKHLPALMGELFSNGYHVVEFKLTKPTLEDVFLKLTGRGLRE